MRRLPRDRGANDPSDSMKATAPPGSFAKHLLQLASKSAVRIRESLQNYGDAPLSDILGELQHAHTVALQARDALWDVIEDQIAPYYGPDVAREAVAELRSDPVIPTTNHFGIDTLADSVQGTLLFACRPRLDGGRRRTVVVLGCGSVSLDNLTYPMGLLLYDSEGSSVRKLPQRLPVFSNRFRRWSAGSVGPFDERMVGRARDRLSKMRLAGHVTPFCERAAGEILDEDFAAQDILSLPTYGHQATRINTRLWNGMFKDCTDVPQFVQLEIEAVCAALLAKDLREPGSLIHRLFFSSAVRNALLTGLDGARACWRRENLNRRLHAAIRDAQARDGTIFFWGLTEDGRRIPLTLEQDAAAIRLAGIDERRRRWGWNFSVDSLVSALRERQLIPSAFTCFTVLAFARGIVCVGGYYQAAYLPVMQRGIVDAIRVEDAGAADLIAQVPTRHCLAGMQFAMRILPGGAGIPAGPVEIAGTGGLTDSDLSRIQSVTVREAYLAAFPDVFQQLVPDATLPDDWIERLTVENGVGCPNLIRLDE